MNINDKVKVSVIVPTYNRCQSLERTLKSVVELDFDPENFEIVVVNNKSTDKTLNVVESFQNSEIIVKVINENRLSFSTARNTGAIGASGDILSYIDDDVVVNKNWMEAIFRVFMSDDSVGIIGGRIDPVFEAEPPDWALAAQEKFNGWSLWHYSDEICEAPGACGPNLSVRKSVLAEVGGFPPDTIGVESLEESGTIEKMYIGPGDYGLSRKVIEAGYKCSYVPDAIVKHYIPPVRLTKSWWNSRQVGESYVRAITNQVEHPRSLGGLVLRSIKSIIIGMKYIISYFSASVLNKTSRDAFQFAFAAAFKQAQVEFALARNPHLATRLWEIGINGVLTEDIYELRKLLP